MKTININLSSTFLVRSKCPRCGDRIIIIDYADAKNQVFYIDFPMEKYKQEKYFKYVKFYTSFLNIKNKFSFHYKSYSPRCHKNISINWFNRKIIEYVKCDCKLANLKCIVEVFQSLESVNRRARFKYPKNITITTNKRK